MYKSGHVELDPVQFKLKKIMDNKLDGQFLFVQYLSDANKIDTDKLKKKLENMTLHLPLSRQLSNR